MTTANSNHLTAKEKPGKACLPFLLASIALIAFLGSDRVYAMDADGDGVDDTDDNCINVQNPDQYDSDGDGFGNRCDPDLNNDLRTDFADLALLKSVFFTTNPDADLNADEKVDFADLAIMKLFFFGPPGPSGLVP